MPFQIRVFVVVFILLIIASIANFKNFCRTNKEDYHMGKLEYNQLSLGRFDFSLPEQFELIGRNQSIYFVEVMTQPIKDISSDSLWHLRLDKIRSENTPREQPLVTVLNEEMINGLQTVSYQKDPSRQVVTVEAQKAFKDHILILTYEGKKGREKDILRLISITVEGYQIGVHRGFNVGFGSITSIPGLHEHAFANFNDKIKQTELTIENQTVGNVFNEHPLDDISDDIKNFALNGIKIKVLKDNRRSVADLPGFEGLITFDGTDEEPIYRYTWFFQGETANSFKPEILIKMTGPTEHLDIANEIWENLLKSFSPRKVN